MNEDTDTVTFPTETIQAVFKNSWKESSTKANKDSIQLSCEFLRLFTTEAVHRAAAGNGRSTDNERRLGTESLEQILPQLLLDF